MGNYLLSQNLSIKIDMRKVLKNNPNGKNIYRRSKFKPFFYMDLVCIII